MVAAGAEMIYLRNSAILIFALHLREFNVFDTRPQFSTFFPSVM